MEEAVFLWMRAKVNRPEEISAFHAQRNKIYENYSDLTSLENSRFRTKKQGSSALLASSSPWRSGPDWTSDPVWPESRTAAKADEKSQEFFQNFYQDYFEKTGLHSFFEKMILDYPLLNTAQTTIFIKRVWSRKQEGAELFFDGKNKTVLINLQIIRLENLAELAAFFRHELMHISDMLDPAFQYRNNPSLGGVCEAENDLVRERFRILWDLYITARLTLQKMPAPATPEKFKKDIQKAFSYQDASENEKLFQTIFSGEPKTQKDLIEYSKPLQSSQSVSNAHCSLCTFPTYDIMNISRMSEKNVIKEIEQSHPGWTPAMKICRQCFEIYQSRVKL